MMNFYLIFICLHFLACSAFAEPLNRIPQAPIAEASERIQQGEAIEFHLYTRNNPTSAQRLVTDNVASIALSNFNANNPTVVAIHGWVDDSSSSFNVAIRDAYLQKSDVNIVMVDWGTLSNALYGASVSEVPNVGKGVARFLSFLNKVTGASLANTHLIGFSLGAHVAGNAGRALGGKVARITGLDPAGPLWYGNANCLKPSDAVYVEAIHSDGNIVGLGIAVAVADADFFPNGGSNQPGCSDLFCNHNRAWELFASTVTFNNLIASRCSNMLQVSTNSCRGDKLPMGNGDLLKRGSGLYRLDTKAFYPF